MKARTVKRLGTVLGCLGVILVLIFAGAISWAITCGLIKLITLCFGWTFNWLVTTGVWLIMILLSGALHGSK